MLDKIIGVKKVPRPKIIKTPVYTVLKYIL